MAGSIIIITIVTSFFIGSAVKRDNNIKKDCQHWKQDKTNDVLSCRNSPGCKMPSADRILSTDGRSTFDNFAPKAVIFLEKRRIRKYAEDGCEVFFCSQLFFCVFVPAGLFLLAISPLNITK